jgi:hypothetical protein
MTAKENVTVSDLPVELVNDDRAEGLLAMLGTDGLDLYTKPGFSTPTDF